MSFAGIVVWNAKYGVPHSYDEAVEMQEQIEEYELDAIDPAFINLANAVQNFAKQAKQFYDNDIVDMYTYFADSLEEVYGTHTIVDFSFVPPDIETIFAAVIVKSARENNLVVRHDELSAVFLPNGQVYQDDSLVDWDDFISYNMTMWQDKIKSFEDVNKQDEETVLEDKSLFKKYTNDLFKAQIKQRKLKGKKTV
ncbi:MULTISPECIES: hypothetical protein [unclassified Acinetobacter]|uniref:hypothetical protein n=1 Tax=unclassified Acinetobacter TaxID=196816 RepID=UPI0035B773C0